MNIRDAAPIAAVLVFAGALGAGIITLIAGGGTIEPASAPVVVTTQPAPAPGRLAPRCFETSTAGAQDCAWIPIAPCLSDEDGDDAVPDGFEGCYWDANTQGNHEGASYVYWRQNRG